MAKPRITQQTLSTLQVAVPRHFASVYVLCITGTYWRLMVFFYSKGKRKVDQTTILANGFKGNFTDIHIPDGKFYMPQTVEYISTFRIQNGRTTSYLGKDHGILQLIQLEISF
jgi:hypothetical protein